MWGWQGPHLSHTEWNRKQYILKQSDTLHKNYTFMGTWNEFAWTCKYFENISLWCNLTSSKDNLSENSKVLTEALSRASETSLEVHNCPKKNKLRNLKFNHWNKSIKWPKRKLSGGPSLTFIFSWGSWVVLAWFPWANGFIYLFI